MNIGDLVAGTMKKLSTTSMDLLKKTLTGKGKAAAIAWLADLIHDKTGVSKVETRKAATRIVNKTATEIRARM